MSEKFPARKRRHLLEFHPGLCPPSCRLHGWRQWYGTPNPTPHLTGVTIFGLGITWTPKWQRREHHSRQYGGGHSRKVN